MTRSRLPLPLPLRLRLQLPMRLDLHPALPAVGSSGGHSSDHSSGRSGEGFGKGLGQASGDGSGAASDHRCGPPAGPGFGPGADSPASGSQPGAAASPARRRWVGALAGMGGAGLLGPWLTACSSAPTVAGAPAAPAVPVAAAVPPVAVNTDPRTPPLQLPEPADARLPSVLLIGDSTVRNGRDDGQGLGPAGQWGWGHVLARYLDPARVNLVNRAIGGLSSRTYRSGGHWARTQAFVKRGDLVLIQFGHNDSSPVNDDQRARGTLRGTGDEQQAITNRLTGQPETVLTYGAYLRAYLAEIRALGATPVLCTPVPRQRRDEQGRTLRGIGSYASWAAEVAREQRVALIDLDAEVAARYDALGPAVVAQLFPRSTPEERVHTNWAGAALNAQVVHAALRAQGLLPAEALLAPPVAALAVLGAGATGAASAPVAGALPAVAGAASPARPPVLEARLPTLFLVGDSTVRSAGQNGQWGWGERLAPWLDGQRLQLANHAMGGRSTRTFLREGRWQAVRAQCQPGDVVLIQFGHNDGGRVGDAAAKQRGVLPGTGPETTEETLPDGSRETVRSFGAYLTRYVREALDAGAVPVLLSPVPHKDRWLQGRDFEQFADWGRSVAMREGALFIDLTMIVTEAYRGLGEAGVATLFADARTHTNDAGARLNAACVARGLRQLPQALLLPMLRNEPLPEAGG
ncbi:rhamnogalacturonan acetylesterase [Aquabacterium sp. OR-4]|uniref:rhamnogalacturonan acetylesterase n=1 Tax=Aquabacterium sp. OR-4 TaxID=2978127 RepID=UPI0028C9A64D|nr:rhamnogalacturonan acetylesterase [Aquabacterium sp. OR-4]MDT7838875.1 rhamnogalacturonan acetylesterase [Aquabacterium sp. OR-4]